MLGDFQQKIQMGQEVDSYLMEYLIFLLNRDVTIPLAPMEVVLIDRYIDYHRPSTSKDNYYPLMEAQDNVPSQEEIWGKGIIVHGMNVDNDDDLINPLALENEGEEQYFSDASETPTIKREPEPEEVDLRSDYSDDSESTVMLTEDRYEEFRMLRDYEGAEEDLNDIFIEYENILVRASSTPPPNEDDDEDIIIDEENLAVKVEDPPLKRRSEIYNLRKLPKMTSRYIEEEDD